MIDLTAQPEEDKLVVDLSNLSPPVVVPEGPALEKRSFMADVALGDASPGSEEVKKLILSGREDELKKSVAANQDARRAQAGQKVALDAVLAGVTEDPITISELPNITPADPEVAIEEEFVNKIVDVNLALSDNPTLVGTVGQEQMNIADDSDAYTEAAMRRLVAERITADYETKAKGIGWVPYAGQMALSLMTFPSWRNIIGDTEGGPKSSSYLTGTNMEQKADMIWAQKPGDMQKMLKAELDALWEFNPQDAMDFLQYFNTRSDVDAMTRTAFDLSAIPAIRGAKAGIRILRGIPKAGKGGKAAIEALKGLKPKPAEEAKKAIQDITEAVAKKNATPAQVLIAAGNGEEAARVLAKEAFLKEALPNASPMTRASLANLGDFMPDWWNPAVRLSPAQGYMVQHADDILQRAKHNVRNFEFVANALGRVATLTKEALEQAYKAAEDAFVNSTPVLSDVIKGVRRYSPEDNLGIASLEFTLGTKTGLFPSYDDALQAASQQYKLADSSYLIEQQGGSYVIKAYKDVSEVGNGIDDLLLTKNNTSKNEGIWAWVKAPLSEKEKVSYFQEANRAAAVHTASALEGKMEEIIEPIRKLYRSGNKEAWRDFNKILTIGRDTMRVPGDPNSMGVFYRNVGELAEAYQIHTKRFPTEAEIDSYFAYTQLSDLDYIVRSIGLWKQKVKTGVKGVSFKAYTGEGQLEDLYIEGKRIDEIPDGSVSYVEISSDGSNRTRKFSDLGSAQKKTFREAVAAGQLKIYRLYDAESPTLTKLTGDDTKRIAYVVASDARETPIRIDKQLNYAPGGHVIYKDKFYAKQALVDGDEFSGEQTLLSTKTQAEANEVSDKIEQALNLYRNKDSNLDTFLRDNLPWTPEEFKKHIQTGRIKKDAPVAAVAAGQRLTDAGTIYANKKTFKDMYPKVFQGSIDAFEDTYRGARDFTEARNGPLQTMRKGSMGEPLWRLENADKVNPLAAQARAMSSLIRNSLYEDYQFQAARSWIEEFGNSSSKTVAGLSYKGKALTIDELRRNPLFYLKNADVSKVNKTRRQQAEQIRSSILNLIGQPSAYAMAIDHFKYSLADFAHAKGKDGLARYISDAEIPFIKDPFVYARAVAYQTKIGMFNPVQVFVQASGLFNSMLVSPISALRAGPTNLAMMAASLTEDPVILKRMATISKMSGGLSEEGFLESRKWMNNMGLMKVGKEQGILDDVSTPQPFRGKMGHVFLDKGQMFFQGAEKTVRMQSWNTAYIDWARANPKKVGKMTNADAQEVLVRTQKYFGNMTRDANAFWQRGATGPFLQFYAYWARMLELMIGNQLKAGERARLVAGYSMLMGTNLGGGVGLAIQEGDLGALEAAVNPFDEDIRSYALKHGYKIDDGIVGFMYNGALSTAFTMATGKKMNIGDRYGLGAPQIASAIRKNFNDYGAVQGLAVSAMGASGSIVGDIFKSLSPVYRDFVQSIGGEGSTSLMVNDILNAGRNISSVEAGTRIYNTWNGLSYISKYGTVRNTDTDPMLETFKALSGLSEIKEQDVFLKIGLLKDRKKQIETLRKDIRQISMHYLHAIESGDQEKATEYNNQIEALINTQGAFLTPKERYELRHPKAGVDEELEDAIDKSFYKYFPKEEE